MDDWKTARAAAGRPTAAGAALGRRVAVGGGRFFPGAVSGRGASITGVRGMFVRADAGRDNGWDVCLMPSPSGSHVVPELSASAQGRSARGDRRFRAEEERVCCSLFVGGH